MLNSPGRQTLNNATEFAFTSYTVSVFSMQTLLGGKACPGGGNLIIWQPSAATYYLLGGLSFTPAVGDMANFGKFATTDRPIDPGWMIFDTTYNLYVVGQTAGGNQGVSAGCFK